MLFTIIERNRDNPKFMNKIEMTGNTMDMCTFIITHVNDILLESNKITRTDTHITSSNVAILNNTYSVLPDYKFIYKCTTDDEKSYDLYIYNNDLAPNIIQEIPTNDFINIHYDFESIDEYIRNKFME